MIPFHSSYLPSSSETCDQVLELINNCVLGSENSVLVLQSVLSSQSLMVLELEYEEEYLGPIDTLSISELLDNEAITFE